MPRLFSRSLAVAVVAFAAVTGVTALPSVAAPATDRAAPAAVSAPSHDKQPDGLPATGSDRASERRTPVKDVRPQNSPPKPATAAAPRIAAAPAAQSCTTADFASRSGAALVAFVKASDTSNCLYNLFSLGSADGRNVFSEAHMVTVADAIRSTAATYPGNDSTGLLQLLLFGRAGFFVQSRSSDPMPDWSATVVASVSSALDAVVASPHFLDVNDENGQIGHETMWFTEYKLAHRYVGAFARVLRAYNSAWEASWNMRDFTNSVFNALYYADNDPGWAAALAADPSLADALHDFAVAHIGLASGDLFFLPGNAALELGRLVQYPGVQAKVRPLVRDLVGRSSIPGPTAAVWVGAAAMTDTHDKANCSYYNTCDFQTKLKAASQSVTYDCDATHKVVSQKMTAAENAAVCSSVLNQDAYFHALVKDNGALPNEYKGRIELDIFGTRNEYKIYSSWLYGNGTDNGGEFLDGTITDPNNQPRFVSFQELNQADGPWAGDVRNLNHEYTHWLDSRYDMKGDFNLQMTVPDIWWVEGVAEYVSYGYRKVTDESMITEAGKHTYNLSTLWETTYENTNTTRTYPWGNLAVRYMFERHPSDITAILAKFRAGDYKGAYAYYSNGIGNRYDADFNTWLDACAAGACRASTTPTLPTCEGSSYIMGQNCQRTGLSGAQGNLNYLTVYVPAGATLTVTLSGGTGDADLYYNPDRWATNTDYTVTAQRNGNIDQITVPNATAGWRYVSLYGYAAYSGVTVTTQF
ncbi:M9 family metallopeptidase [Yinghuangia seranimata]|uniref:M9 family metallopeptidase n=1 Tax=Yinghuangia seranimata TaxID=408067 RepID=UPI00248B79A5|nr:M9 family metallopeptidase [Yinghuangia seranimata]MDI2129869.1 collagenase [Yinghuangia seranimata]